MGWLKYQPRHDKNNKMSVRPAKTQISLGIRTVWSESSLCAQWVAKDPSFLHADSEDSDQTGRMPRLIWVFARRIVTLSVLSCRDSYIPEGFNTSYIDFTVADPEGVRGVRSNPFETKLFHFHGELYKNLRKLIKSNPPEQIWTPYPKFLDPPLLYLQFLLK